MDYKYTLAFEGSNYPSLDAYVGKYIKQYVLPLHLGDYIFAKITGVLEEGSSVLFQMEAGSAVYQQAKMPDAYEAF